MACRSPVRPPKSRLPALAGCGLGAALALSGGLPARAQEAAAPGPVLGAPSAPTVSRGVFLVREYRNPTFAAVASMGFPGGGQVYNDDLAKFLVAVAGLGGSAGLFFATQDTTLRIVGGTGFGLIWLWSVGDAYLSAATYNHLLEQQALH